MDTISTVFIAFGVLGVVLLPGAGLALSGAHRRIYRLMDRNAAQAVIIAGMEKRLAGLRPIDRESGISGPSGIDRGSQATQVPPGPEIASGGANFGGIPAEDEVWVYGKDWESRTPQPGDPFTAAFGGRVYRGTWPDAPEVSVKPDTDISANKGA